MCFIFDTWLFQLIWNNTPDKVRMRGPKVSHQLVQGLLEEGRRKEVKDDRQVIGVGQVAWSRGSPSSGFAHPKVHFIPGCFNSFGMMQRTKWGWVVFRLAISLCRDS